MRPRRSPAPSRCGARLRIMARWARRSRRAKFSSLQSLEKSQNGEGISSPRAAGEGVSPTLSDYSSNGYSGAPPSPTLPHKLIVVHREAEGGNFPPRKALKSHETRKESRETGTVHARRSSRSAGVTKRTRRAAWGVIFAQCSVEKSSTASPQVGKAPAMRVLSSFGPAAVS
jgi:hypothetical protein